jgi:hypothetical protein
MVEESQIDAPFGGLLARFGCRVGWLPDLVVEPFTSTPFSATAILLRGGLWTPEQR